MNKLLLLLLSISILSCSSDDEEPKIKLPEKFDIKFEIKGEKTIPISDVFFTYNGISVKEFKDSYLPLTAEYTHYTKESDINTKVTPCIDVDCILISVWAYLSPEHKMEEFNLYVDGKLVDSTTITEPLVVIEGVPTLFPTILKYQYFY